MERTRACAFLEGRIREWLENDVNVQEYIDSAYYRHGIPIHTTSDILFGKAPVAKADDITIFCLVEAINPKRLPMYFSEEEIQRLKKYYYETEQIKFPLVFRVRPTIDNTWRGVIDSNYLMELRKAGLILVNHSDYKEGKIIRYRNIIDTFDEDSYRSQTIELRLTKETKYEYTDDEMKVFDSDGFGLYIISGYESYVEVSSVYNAEKPVSFEIPLRITI